MIPAWHAPTSALNRNGVMVVASVQPTAVHVRDPNGEHRFFKIARLGTRTEVNKLGDTVMSVVVHVDGRDYCVPVHWVCQIDGLANVIAFPRRTP